MSKVSERTSLVNLNWALLVLVLMGADSVCKFPRSVSSTLR